MKNTGKVLALALALLVSVSLFSACGGSEKTPSATPSASESAAPSTQPSADSAAPDVVTYPLTDGHTFKCWWPLDNNLTTVITSMADHPYFVKMKEITGVSFNFTHPTMGNEGESYNLLIASGDYGDMIVKFGMYHTRGLDDAVESGIILDMKDYLDYLPNYQKRRTQSAEFEKNTITDSGHLAGLATIYKYQNDSLGVINGISIRQDWLKKLGLQTPTTISELENVMTEFKNKIPSCANGPLFYGIWGAGVEGAWNAGSAIGAFTYKDGAVRYYATDPAYKDYVTTMASWYNKGLIFKDFMSESSFIARFNNTDKIANGEMGVFYDCYVNLIPYEQLGVTKDPDFDVEPIAYPTLNKGDTIHTGWNSQTASQGMLGITSQCADVELACRFWDYGYSDDGIQLANYGEEGKVFNYDGAGAPHYTELIYKNPDPSITPYVAENIYILQNAPYCFIADRSMDYWTDVEIKACQIWAENSDSEYTLPSLNFTAEEGTANAAVLSDVNTFISENVTKFIVGTKPLSEFDAFAAELKTLGIDKVIANYEAALDRYNNRGK